MLIRPARATAAQSAAHGGSGRSGLVVGREGSERVFRSLAIELPTLVTEWIATGARDELFGVNAPACWAVGPVVEKAGAAVTGPEGVIWTDVRS